ncbi:hypothetical protein [Ornithinibacillus caprae]|nr:hypothetical protein [Ornithinibacillus caprae]
MKNIKALVFLTFLVFMFAFSTIQDNTQLLCDPEYGELDNLNTSS